MKIYLTILTLILLTGAVSTAQADEPQPWYAESFIDENTGLRTYLAFTRAVVAEGAEGAEDPFSLSVACVQGATVVNVGWGSYVGYGDQDVSYVVTPGVLEARTWQATRNHTVLIGGAVPLLLRILAEGGAPFGVRTVLAPSSPRTLVFDMRGLAAALVDVRRVCRW